VLPDSNVNQRASPWEAAAAAVTNNKSIDFIIIINPRNGQDYDKFNQNWQAGIQGFKILPADNAPYKSNVSVLGYIDFQYGDADVSLTETYISQALAKCEQISCPTSENRWGLSGVALMGLGWKLDQAHSLQKYQDLVLYSRLVDPSAPILGGFGIQYGWSSAWLNPVDYKATYINTYADYKDGVVAPYPAVVREKYAMLLQEGHGAVCPDVNTANAFVAEAASRFGWIWISKNEFWACGISSQLICITDAVTQYNASVISLP
jgi:hypothetical protein